MTGSRLADLARLVGGEIRGDEAEVIVTDITHDSREAAPGWMFAAVSGAHSDGHQFSAQAVANGATALCVEHRAPEPVPQLLVGSTREALGPLAAEIHDNPSHDLAVIGVTGTNGKTTVTHWISAMAEHAGLTTGLIGTIQTRIGAEVHESVRTTPEATDFHRLLAQMRDAGCQVVATEVSSHALTMGRVRATRFDVVAFTNLSQDHLDFHDSMEAYYGAKERLFQDYEARTAVINVDDAAGARIAAGMTGRRVITVGLEGVARAEQVRMTSSRSTFRLVTPWGSSDVSAPVIGRFNIDNVVMASSCALAAGLEWGMVVAAIEELPQVPGRYEKVSGDDPIAVIVDYAHTPVGITKAVETARGLDGDRVIVVFGAGGDRDREKRPLMGAAASAADVIVVTTDNPRSEDPAEIIASVLEGAGPETMVEIDRTTAIRAALAEASDGDIVLVLGRGHEPNQEVAGQFIPLDDREVARTELARLRSSADSDSGPGSMHG
jgi:UDP-N-acetylmuramoyl-L-alanyl-D-glutamate--2,6-diaminopimelate ligase